jgi:hypothetical protein
VALNRFSAGLRRVGRQVLIGLVSFKGGPRSDARPVSTTTRFRALQGLSG